MQSQSINISMFKAQKNRQWKGSQSRAKCIGNYESMFLCVNQDCTEKVLFTCGNQKCQCQWLHSQCITAKLSWINNTINSKIQDAVDIKAFIQQSVDKIIDKVSEFRDNLLSKIEGQLKYYKMNETQINFMDCYYNMTPLTNFKPYDSSFLWDILKKREQIQRNAFTQIKSQIKRFQMTVQDNIQNIKLNIEDYMGTGEDQNVQQSQLFEKLKTQLTTKSSICKESQLSLRLLKFFPCDNIASIQLIFKASENDFNVQKFYQLYSRTPNLLLLCLSDKDKIVGGFTPLTFCQDIYRDKGGNNENKQRLSFIFSLTNDHKFNLVRKNKALGLSGQKKYIQFGNQEIVIYDMSNTNLQCILSCKNDSYQNYNYQNDPESFKKFNGNQTSKCAIKQWEFWKIKFQESQESLCIYQQYNNHSQRRKNKYKEYQDHGILYQQKPQNMHRHREEQRDYQRREDRQEKEVIIERDKDIKPQINENIQNLQNNSNRVVKNIIRPIKLDNRQGGSKARGNYGLQKTNRGQKRQQKKQQKKQQRK